MTIYQNNIAGSGFLQGATGAPGPAANTFIQEYEYIATQGQTLFSGNDKYGNPMSYAANGIFVALNGSLLNELEEYSAINGSSLTLNQAASANDELIVYTFPAFNVANTYTQQQANTIFLSQATANGTFASIANTYTQAQANTIFLKLTGGTISGNVNFANGSNFTVPVGNTAQRPVAAAGFIRYNTDLNTLESANATAWANVGSGSASSGGSSSNVASVTGNVYISSAGGLIDASNATLGFVFPAGTYAQRPIATANGTARWNTSNTQLEVYVGGGIWQAIAYSSYPVAALILAGGGGSANYGGGGAGGLLYVGSTYVVPGTPYTVTVGGGGAASSSGSNSSAINQSAIGGGGGYASTYTARSGGSGAGNSFGSGYGGPGSGTTGQGNPGGQGMDGISQYTTGGGGGGAGASGGAASGSQPGPAGSGGTGTAYSISGTSTTYAGGGGGASNAGPQAGGGAGGGGTGNNTGGTNGGTNLGGGGGGGGGTGGSGIVIIQYAGTQRGTGGTYTYTGGYSIHTFTSSATFTA